MNIIVLVTCCYRDEITAQFFRLTRSVPAWFSSLAFVFPLLPASVWHSAHRILIPDLLGNDSNLLIVFYVQIMPDDFVMQLHRF